MHITILILFLASYSSLNILNKYLGVAVSWLYLHSYPQISLNGRLSTLYLQPMAKYGIMCEICMSFMYFNHIANFDDGCWRLFGSTSTSQVIMAMTYDLYLFGFWGNLKFLKYMWAKYKPLELANICTNYPHILLSCKSVYLKETIMFMLLFSTL